MNNSDAYDAGAGAGSAGGAAGGAGVAGAAGSTLPLRGLAMVLISVAILLGLWGIFALTSSDETTATNTANNAQESAAEGGEGANGSGNKAGNNDGRGDGHNAAPADGDRREGDHAGHHADGDHADGAHPDAVGRNGEAGTARDGARPEGAPAPGERRQGAGGAGAGPGAGAQQTFDVTVLNNSTVSGLAHRVTESLEREGQQTRESGNLPGGEKVLRENTVFFPAGNAAAEQRARELAERVGGVARENMDYLPREATDNNGLTMVLIGEVSI